MTDPFLQAAAYRGVMPRQRAHEGPALTIYPRKPKSGWFYVVGGLVLLVFGLAMVFI